eukprot:6208536-Pleurochrysis_carterae.AAC.2
MSTKRTLLMVSPWGKWRRTSTARASPRPKALNPSVTAWYALLMRAYVEGWDDVITTVAMTM